MPGTSGEVQKNGFIQDLEGCTYRVGHGIINKARHDSSEGPRRSCVRNVLYVCIYIYVIYIYICIHVYTCVYIYIYIYRARERERERELCKGMCTVTHTGTLHTRTDVQKIFVDRQTDGYTKVGR